MDYNAIHSVFLACPDLAACEPYEKLGLRVSAASESRWLEVGSAGRRFSLQFMADPKGRFHHAPGGGLVAVALRVTDAAGVVAKLVSHVKGQSPPPAGVEFPAAWLCFREQAGTDIVLVEAAATDEPAPEHGFPLRRLDHLAAVAPDLEAKTRFWTDVLEVPLAGEVVTPTLVIRQFRIGDAVLELLGPASADSPIHKRTPGLVSMASWEVPDLDEAVRLARAAGFTASDPSPGVLPGTRIATIPGTELAGVNMQLLQYV